MKLLILGESDSKGWGLGDRTLAWGNRLPGDIERRFGVEVDATHASFYTHATSSLAYLEKLLAEGPFDIVVFSTTTIGFTLLSVDNRVRRFFGKSAGDFVKRRVDNFDRRTRKGADEGPLRRANRLIHTIARNTIGQDPMASYAQVLSNHLQVVARLARLEDTDVIVLGCTDHGGRLAQRVRKTQPQVETFRAAIREETLRRRLAYVDRQALSLAGRDRDGEFIDGLHKGPAFHERIAKAIVAAMKVPAGGRVAVGP